eukprot:Nitzschia sp. Nitz4//scaffold162_size51285//50215//51072//NITZ4_006979-RA/size51285-processed-gene-0.39-mRNA-1//1//CDS//3329538003//7629//frame0
MNFEVTPIAAVTAFSVLITSAWFVKGRAGKSKSFAIHKKDWEKDHVYFYTFGGSEDRKLKSFSPSCLKLYTWLKLSRIPHTVIYGIALGPTGKAPFIELNGQAYGESTSIVKMLSKHFGKDLDAGLSKYDQAVATTVMSTLEYDLYFMEVYSRWVDNSIPFRDRCLYDVPAPVRVVLFRFLQRSVIAALNGQGTGKLSNEIRQQKVHDMLDALVDILGDNKFLFGDTPCLADCSAYGLLAGMLWGGVDTMGNNAITARSTLVAYVERVDELRKNAEAEAKATQQK